MERGMAEGMEKGQVTARREDILRIGTKRFGKPARKAREVISELSDLDRLDMLFDRALDASSWNELIAD